MIIKNRFGRIVEVPEEQGRIMIKSDGATLYEPDLTPVASNQTPVVKNPLECPYCGKICVSQLGFNKHATACKKKALLSQS